MSRCIIMCASRRVNGVEGWRDDKIVGNPARVVELDDESNSVDDLTDAWTVDPTFIHKSGSSILVVVLTQVEIKIFVGDANETPSDATAHPVPISGGWTAYTFFTRVGQNRYFVRKV